MSHFHQFDFEALPKSAKLQLPRSIEDFDYLIYTDASKTNVFYVLRVMLLVFCTFLLWSKLSSQFGDPLTDTGWGTPEDKVVYTVFIFGMAYALYSMLLRYRLQKKFGFPPGRYLFAFALVDARSTKIGIYDLAHFEKAQIKSAEPGHLFSRTTVYFRFSDGRAATLKLKANINACEVLEKLNDCKQKAYQAFKSRDLQLLYRYDPLADARKDKWSKQNKLKSAKHSHWLYICYRSPAALTFPIALILSWPVWYARSYLSDEAMYQEAKRLKSEAAYSGYFRTGKLHIDELNQAFPRVVFDEIKRLHSVSKLRVLKQRFPDSDIQKDVNSEIHILFQKSLEKFRKNAASTDPKLTRTIEELLDYLEKHDSPRLDITFIRPTMAELTRLDSRLKEKEAKFMDRRITPAAQFFGDDSAVSRESRIAQGMRRAFLQIFPNDILSLQPIIRPRPNTPTLKIRYEIEPSGMVYTSESENRTFDWNPNTTKRNNAFVGLVIRFNGELSVPSVDESWRFKLEVMPPDHFSVEYQRRSNERDIGPQDGQVYAVMAERAFDKLSDNLTSAFFREDSDVYIKHFKKSNFQ